MGDGRNILKSHCASLFNDDLSNEPNFGRIHLAGQYLLNSRLLIGVLRLIFRSAYSPGPEREAASKYWLELLSVSQPGMRGWVWGPDYPWDFLLTVLETAAAALATRRPTRCQVCFYLFRIRTTFIRFFAGRFLILTTDSKIECRKFWILKTPELNGIQACEHSLQCP